MSCVIRLVSAFINDTKNKTKTKTNKQTNKQKTVACYAYVIVNNSKEQLNRQENYPTFPFQRLNEKHGMTCFALYKAYHIKQRVLRSEMLSIDVHKMKF